MSGLTAWNSPFKDEVTVTKSQTIGRVTVAPSLDVFSDSIAPSSSGITCYPPMNHCIGPKSLV
jgi:hypothetical protein